MIFLEFTVKYSAINTENSGCFCLIAVCLAKGLADQIDFCAAALFLKGRNRGGRP